MTSPLRARFPDVRHVVVLTGAGVSVASGLKTFRGPGGLWTSNAALANELVAGVDPSTLWRVALDWRREIHGVEPNEAHLALARFEAAFAGGGRTFTLVTQNIDGLHEKAGSTNVIALHGDIRQSRCSSADCRSEPFVDDSKAERPPSCDRCGSPIRPNIVLFDEPLGAREEVSAKRALREVELFVAIGTSGTVSPASNFVRSAQYAGAHTILVNVEIPEPRLFAENHVGTASELVPVLFASP